MRFTPKSEEEITAANLLEGGEYPFEVADAEEGQSKSGNDMIKLRLKVLGPDERQYGVFDYLVGTEGSAYKVRHFAESVGLLPQYEAGELEAISLIGRTGYCQVGIDDKNKAYPAKNVIRDYLAKVSAASGSGVPSNKPKGQAPAMVDDDIPFNMHR